MDLPSTTVENYLKTIYTLQHSGHDQRLALGELAKASGVTPGTTTTMMKRLAESGLVDYKSREGVKLTTKGRRSAMLVIRKARLIELFLIKHLDFDWTEVHEEAELLEHAVSDRLLERIDEALGHPAFDPHGDPIPNARGQIVKRDLTPLSECSLGEYQIARIEDHSKAFLDYLDAHQLHPGESVEVIDIDRIAQVIHLTRSHTGSLSLGLGMADKIHVMHAE